MPEVTAPLRVAIPTFHCEQWFWLAGQDKWCAATRLDVDRDETQMTELGSSVVEIDGATYRCIGVERFTHSPPWRQGEPISLMIHGEPCI